MDTRTAASHSLIGQLTHFLHMDRYFSAVPDQLPGSLSLPELLDHVVTFSAAGIRGLAQVFENTIYTFAAVLAEPPARRPA